MDNLFSEPMRSNRAFESGRAGKRRVLVHALPRRAAQRER
jgi:hypothetical protein